MKKKKINLLDQNKIIKSVYLIQRILKKHPDNPKFAFGANGEGTHLSKPARIELNTFCNFDSMGAAQYEMSELPDALETMRSLHKKGDLLTIHEINFDELKVYVLSNCSLLGEVIPVIHSLRAGEIDSRNYSYFSKAAMDLSEEERLRGWICEDNYPFMFFIDKEMTKDFKNFLNTFKGPILNPQYVKKLKRERTLLDLLNMDEEKFEKELNKLLKKKEYLP